jgi:hypothetical protein
VKFDALEGEEVVSLLEGVRPEVARNCDGTSGGVGLTKGQNVKGEGEPVLS